MIDREHDLPITKQAQVLRISRGSVYYLPRPVSAADLAIMRRLDRLHLEFPFAGSRMLRGLLVAEGCKIGRRHVKTLMQRMGIEALYRRPRTRSPSLATRSTRICCAGMRSRGRTRLGDGHHYIPMARGFVFSRLQQSPDKCAFYLFLCRYRRSPNSFDREMFQMRIAFHPKGLCET